MSQNIKLSNPHTSPTGGNYLHNGAFGSIFLPGPTQAKIEEVQASNIIESWNRMASKYMIVDRTSVNNGTDKWASLIFGGDNSGEYMLSKRTLGQGQNGIDILTNSKFRMHIGNNGAIGIGTFPGSQATVAFKGRMHINNMVSTEQNFQQDINLYTTSANEAFDNTITNNIFSGQRAGIVNHLSLSSINPTQSNSSLQLFRDIIPVGTIYPSGNTGFVNNMRSLTAPIPSSGSTINYRHVYGIVNDLNDQKLAKFVFPDPWGQNITVYNSRIGLLSVTNTNSAQEYGSGKIAGWFVNNGGRTATSPSTPSYMDGWGLWVDGATFLRSNYWTVSDEKAKENITGLNKLEILKKLQRLNPVQYNYKNQKGIFETGLLSQELAKIFPQMVVNAINPATKEELLAIQYNQLHSVTIAAIQAQQQQINELKELVKKLVAKNK